MQMFKTGPSPDQLWVMDRDLQSDHPNNMSLTPGSTRLSEWSELDQAAPTFIPRGAHILRGACIDGIGMGKMHVRQ